MGHDDCVVILAGGEGSRLKPYTNVLPKPLIPVGDVPILEVVIQQLRHAGFTRLFLAVNYLDGLIRSYFRNGEDLGVSIAYSKEKRPLGTIGPLHLVADSLPESFLVMNGDILTDLDYRTCLDAHKRSNTELTLVTFERRLDVGFGVAHVDERNAVTGFQEKPAISLSVVAGVYAMNRAVLAHVPGDRAFGIDDLVLTMLKAGLRVNNYGHRGEWYDIGRQPDLERANDAFARRRHKFLRRENELAGVA